MKEIMKSIITDRIPDSSRTSKKLSSEPKVYFTDRKFIYSEEITLWNYFLIILMNLNQAILKD